MAQGMTSIFKEATRRSRPEGSGFSFPSCHTTMSLASATALQRHFGWKVGIPAYRVAYVGASRVEMERHYLNDVAFGTAPGIAAGRTITVGGRHRFMIAPLASTAGVGRLLHVARQQVIRAGLVAPNRSAYDWPRDTPRG